jgi:hypothetical protein
MKNALKLAMAVSALALIQAPAFAAGGFGLTGKVGTLGYGVEGTTSLTEKLNLRFGYQTFSYGTQIDIDTTTGTSKMDTDLNMDTGSLLLDWHAFGGAFRLSGGIMSNKTDLTGSAPGDNYQIGDNTYLVGLDTSVTYDDKIVPYVGIGWGNAVDPKKRWVFSADLGVKFNGDPTVNLTPTGPGAGFVPESDIAKEEARIADDLSKFDLYPVATIGVSYRFK